MSKLLFIRHAETDMAGTFCGRSDPELNTRGQAQLGELIGRLRNEEIGVVYTSDLRRAHTTARTIAEAFAVDCCVRPALREIDFGQWDGLTWKEIERRDGVYARRWIADYPSLPAPDGENYRDFERRVLDEVKFLSLEAEAADCCIAVVTHAGVLRTVLCALHGCSEDSAREQTRSYCSVVRHPASAFHSTARQSFSSNVDTHG
jgi:alpha-ribazole phosphatase/probable phosphoglycerate mutase